jgi:hypothetical protein
VLREPHPLLVRQLAQHVLLVNMLVKHQAHVIIVLLVHMMTILIRPLSVQIVLREPHPLLVRLHVVLLATRENMQPRVLPRVLIVFLAHMMTILMHQPPVKIVVMVNHQPLARLHVPIVLLVNILRAFQDIFVMNVIPVLYRPRKQRLVPTVLRVKRK